MSFLNTPVSDIVDQVFALPSPAVVLEPLAAGVAANPDAIPAPMALFKDHQEKYLAVLRALIELQVAQNINSSANAPTFTNCKTRGVKKDASALISAITGALPELVAQKAPGRAGGRAAELLTPRAGLF